MKIPEPLKKLLSEEQIALVKAEFDKQVEIAVESALHAYEDDAIKEIEKTLNMQSEMHIQKLIQLKEKAIKSQKILKENLSKKYTDLILKDADKYKTKLANTIEEFITENFNKVVPYKLVAEAAKNKTASIVLTSLREQLAVDTAFSKKAISAPVIDLNNKLGNTIKLIKHLKEENNKLANEAKQNKSKLIIEQHISSLPSNAANHMRRMLQGKDEQYINENFQYILDLYNDGQEKKKKVLTEQAITKRSKSPNRVTEPKRSRDLIVTESSKQNNLSGYENLINEIGFELSNSDI